MSDAAKAPKAKGGKSKLLIIIAVAVLLLGGGGAAFVLTGGFGLMGGGDDHEAHAEGEHDAHGDDKDADHGKKDKHDAHSASKHVDFVALPDLLVNLQGSGSRPHFLKLVVAFEIDNDDAAEALDKYGPRIIDSFQIYLRSLKPEDLADPASVFRLKENLLARTNSAIAPASVNDVLFKEILVQ